MKKSIFAIAIVALMSSCTKNEMAKNFGGTMVIDLTTGQKLVNVTWKEDEIWYLTKPMSASDSAETYSFHESSSFGIMEGTVIVKEHKN
jgi:hypothetical protein